MLQRKVTESINTYILHSIAKKDEVTGEWRKLYNEELNDL
jgi:hypothetical protein